MKEWNIIDRGIYELARIRAATGKELKEVLREQEVEGSKGQEGSNWERIESSPDEPLHLPRELEEEATGKELKAIICFSDAPLLPTSRKQLGKN